MCGTDIKGRGDRPPWIFFSTSSASATSRSGVTSCSGSSYSAFSK
jgi:hypothetical protein